MSNTFWEAMVMTKEDWVKALRSGKYPQNSGGLVDDYDCIGAYCCLAVAGKIAGHDLNETPYTAIRCSFGISPEVETFLIAVNDTKQWSFGKIADWIEANDLSTANPK